MMYLPQNHGEGGGFLHTGTFPGISKTITRATLPWLLERLLKGLSTDLCKLQYIVFYGFQHRHLSGTSPAFRGVEALEGL